MGRVVGFELATTSAWKRFKSSFYDPAVQILTNAAAMALMIVFPPSAAVVMPALAVSNIVNTVDDLYTKHQKDKLELSDASIGLLSIGLDVLPMARGAKLLNPARSTLQELKGGLNWRLVAFDALNLGGQILVMYEQTRDALAAIQEKQIAVLADRYRARIDLEKQNHNPSDPRLAQMRAEIEQDAHAVRETTRVTWTNAVANRAAFMVGPQFLGPGHHGKPQVDATYAGRSGDEHHAPDVASKRDADDASGRTSRPATGEVGTSTSRRVDATLLRDERANWEAKGSKVSRTSVSHESSARFRTAVPDH